MHLSLSNDLELVELELVHPYKQMMEWCSHNDWLNNDQVNRFYSTSLLRIILRSNPVTFGSWGLNLLTSQLEILLIVLNLVDGSAFSFKATLVACVVDDYLYRFLLYKKIYIIKIHSNSYHVSNCLHFIYIMSASHIWAKRRM